MVEHKAPEAERRRGEGDDETVCCVCQMTSYCLHPTVCFYNICLKYWDMSVKLQLSHIFTDVYKNAKVN